MMWWYRMCSIALQITQVRDIITSSWFCCDHSSFFTSCNTQLGVTSTMTHRTFWFSLKSSLIVVSEAFFSALRRNIALQFCLSLKQLSSSFGNGQFLLCYFFCSRAYLPWPTIVPEVITNIFHHLHTRSREKASLLRLKCDIIGSRGDW